MKAHLAVDNRRRLWVEYSVVPADDLLLPPAKLPERADDLWKTTCFELFVRPSGSDGYFELNFSPSFQWAAYEFTGYRQGRRAMEILDPGIWLSQPEGWFFLAVEGLPDFPAAALKIGLSAVIEEKDGTKSYWALMHPPGEPDFHHPDCFLLDLPPPAQA